MDSRYRALYCWWGIFNDANFNLVFICVTSAQSVLLLDMQTGGKKYWRFVGRRLLFFFVLYNRAKCFGVFFNF